MNGTCSVSPTLARRPGNGRRFESSGLEIYVKFGGGLGFRMTRKAVKRRQRRRTMASVVSPVETLRRITGGMAKGRPQRPASAFVFLNGGDSGGISISSGT